jgi:hypothetical protein
MTKSDSHDFRSPRSMKMIEADREGDAPPDGGHRFVDAAVGADIPATETTKRFPPAPVFLAAGIFGPE